MRRKKKAAKTSGKSAKADDLKKFFRKFTFKKLKGQKRSIALAAALSFILIISGIFALAFDKTTTTQTDEIASSEVEELETAEPLMATVTLSSGVIEYKTDGIWTDVTENLEIFTGMTLKTTGAASKAIITLEDGSEIRLGADTEIKLETLTVARVVVVQDDGHVYNRVVPSEGRSYVVQTENAQFQSVGTAFQTIASGDEEAVEVYQSSVRETTTNIRAEEGDKLTVKNFSDPNKDEKVEKIDIEQLKDNTFITWNRELDLQNETFKASLGFLSDYDGPSVSVTEPAAGAALDVESDTTEGTVQIKGNTEKNAKLTVQSKSQAGSSPIDVVVGDDGNFVTPVLNAPLGTSVFEFVATDKVGNKATTNISYTFRKQTVVQEQGIALSVNDDDPDELVFEWGLAGMTTPDGVKLVYSKNTNPTYDEDSSKYISSGSSTTLDTNKLKSGETYYFRVCRYDDVNDKCDVYSNQVSVEIE